METIVIKTNEIAKTQILIEMLKSMDFITNVTHFSKFLRAKNLFDEINNIAEDTELATLTLNDINTEIRAHRNGE